MGMMTLMIVVRVFLLVAIVHITARVVRMVMFFVRGIVHTVICFELIYIP